MMDMSKLVYWIWLATRIGVGPARIKPLLNYFDTPECIYKTGYKDLRDINGLNASVVKELMNKDLFASENIIQKCQRLGFGIVTQADSQYPDRLKNIYDPPVVLYVKGNLPKVNEYAAIGIVGTRRCTPYGLKNAEAAGYKLSKRGFIVVTGLAEGIDTAATKGALQGNTPTIGVIGSGLDIVFPAQNRSLYEAVSANGAVISEYSPGTPAVKGHFPSRNRIISGISNGVAVIEAPERSGALITADRALEQGRDVFSLPGNVDATACAGSNKLLRDGAIPFITADDIIDEYRDSLNTYKKLFDNTATVEYIGLDKLINKLDGSARIIAESIGNKPVDTSEIIATTGLDTQSVLSTLTIMELDGYLQRNIIGKWEIVK